MRERRPQRAEIALGFIVFKLVAFRKKWSGPRRIEASPPRAEGARDQNHTTPAPRSTAVACSMRNCINGGALPRAFPSQATPLTLKGDHSLGRVVQTHASYTAHTVTLTVYSALITHGAAWHIHMIHSVTPQCTEHMYMYIQVTTSYMASCMAFGGAHTRAHASKARGQ